MGEEAVDTAATAPRRAGTGRVVGTMAVVALVAVTVVVASARMGGGNPADNSGVEETVPTTLAGDIAPGPVPDEIVAAFDAPVIGAVNMDDPPQDAVASCADSMGIAWEGPPEIEAAVATPDGLFLSLLGNGSAGPDMGMDGAGEDKFRTTCSAQFEGGEWFSNGGGMEVVVGESGLDGGGGSSYSCCDENGLATASGSVDVPEEAAWAVQDRYGWHLAYPVGDQTRLVVTWKFRESQFGGGAPPQSQVTFMNDDGVVVGEAFAGGQF